MTDTYANVDGAQDIIGALDWQDRIDTWPQFRAYKARSFDLTAGSRMLAAESSSVILIRNRS